MTIEPSVLFDAEFYRSQNPDLASFDDNQLLQHLLAAGLNEGRNFSPVVDLDLYAAANPDLAAAGLTTQRQLFDHLAIAGVAENRTFSLFFDPSAYADNNPDLAAAGVSGTEALFAHYSTAGIDEGRTASIFLTTATYREIYEDLAALSERQLAEHFSTFGLDEGRIGSLSFEVTSYLQTSPDLQAAGLTNRQAALHFLQSGSGEGRSPVGENLPFGFPFNASSLNLSGFVGSIDPVDIYQLDLDTTSLVRLSAPFSTNNPNISGRSIRLAQTPTADAIALLDTTPGLSTPTFPGGSNGIEVVLDPGTYFVTVRSTNAFFSGGVSDLRTFYDLQASVEPTELSADPSATMGSLGTLGLGVLSFSETAPPGDEDLYFFDLDAAALVSAQSANVLLELGLDANGNGIADPGEAIVSDAPSLIITSPRFQRNAPASLDAFLEPATGYYIRATRSVAAGFPTNFVNRGSAYDLGLSALFSTPENATAAGAETIDLLTGERVSSFGVVFAGEDDFYQFDVDTERAIDIELSPFGTPSIGENASILPPELFQDTNGNGIADPGETIPISPDLTLAPGTYLLRVPGGPQRYQLDLELL